MLCVVVFQYLDRERPSPTFEQVEEYLLPVAKWIISKYGSLTQEKFTGDKNYFADILTQFAQTGPVHVATTTSPQ